MASRIVVFGATGYTGRLVSEALVARGAKPVLAGRNAPALAVLATELGGLETAVADVSSPETVRALVAGGDVLVSTVGPFVRWGDPAVQAAIDAGASYIDSTGEAAFIRAVFERYGPGAQAAGCGLVTAFGYDWVPGNLAAGLALREAGESAVIVEIGYFVTGSTAPQASGGTRASVAHVMVSPGFAWRDGRLVTERGAARVHAFELNGRSRRAISVASSEHFALPRIAPQLREVDVYLGWFGPLSRPLQAFSLATAAVTRLPGSRALIEAALKRTMKGSSGGPDAEERAKTGAQIVAIARDVNGAELARVELRGPNGYTFTGDIIAWGAIAAAEQGLAGVGALGPIDAFGLDALEAGCASAGLVVQPPSASTQ
jgi:short subunit dehydrogenase-like uncharacterized protein